MKILVHSNAPWASTGYGQQTGMLCEQFRRLGHEVAVSAFYGLSGSVLNWNGTNVYPSGVDPYGNDVLVAHADQFGADLIVTLVDVWVLNGQQLTRKHVASWTPVDHRPPPPKVIEFFHQSGAWPVAMSRFGYDQLAAADLSPLYVPHAIDTGALCPRDRSESRATWNIPQDAFVVGIVAANKGNDPFRKSFPESIRAFARFLETHDDAFLYIHAEPSGVFHGVNLHHCLADCGVPADRAAITDAYYTTIVSTPVDSLAELYSAFDVLLNPSYGEGFGLTVLEAQACGTPVIVNDATAMRELCGSGWLVENQPFYTNQSSWMFIPSIDSIYEKLCAAWRAVALDRGGVAGKATAFAAEYDATVVADTYWRPVLATLAERMQPLEIAA